MVGDSPGGGGGGGLDPRDLLFARSRESCNFCTPPLPHPLCPCVFDNSFRFLPRGRYAQGGIVYTQSEACTGPERGVSPDGQCTQVTCAGPVAIPGNVPLTRRKICLQASAFAVGRCCSCEDQPLAFRSPPPPPGLCSSYWSSSGDCPPTAVTPSPMDPQLTPLGVWVRIPLGRCAGGASACGTEPGRSHCCGPLSPSAVDVRGTAPPLRAQPHHSAGGAQILISL